MPKRQKSDQHLKPSDAYFKAIFKNKEVALQLIRYAMPPAMAAQLNLKTLELAPESFIDEKLRESLSDLVYACRLKGGTPIRICLLFEHKSNNVGKELYPQLSRYMVGIQEEDIKQRRRHFTLTMPILFYNGKKKWQPLPAAAFYGEVPESLVPFIPGFRFLVVNLQEKSDAEILAMREAMLLRNIFLAMKHAWEDNFYRQYYQEVFIFVHSDLSEEMLLSLFMLTFEYIYQVSSLKEEELMGIAEKLPPKHKEQVKSTWEMMVEKYSKIGLQQGLEQGLEQGRELGIDKAIENILTKRPNLPDTEVAELLAVTVERVQRIRASLNNSKNN